jgi:Zn-dependent protease with chaperone function
MNIDVLVPAFVAALAAVLATASHKRLRPEVGAPLLAASMIAVVVAVVPAVLVLAIGFLTHLPGFHGSLSWCREVVHDHGHTHPRVPAWLGIPAVALLGLAGARLHRVERSWRRLRRQHSDGVEVLPSEAVFAYTMPGPGGHVVVSDGLVRRLDERELAVVLAHERAHARHRHDRFVLVGSITVALLPLLAPLHRRLRFALERWADEETVASLSVARSVVARTVATVALSHTAVPAGVLRMGGLGVPARVAALLEPAPSGRSWPSLLGGAVGVVAVLGAAGVQAHHVVPYLVTLCPG